MNVERKKQKRFLKRSFLPATLFFSLLLVFPGLPLFPAILPADENPVEVDEQQLQDLYQQGVEFYNRSDHTGALEVWMEGLELSRDAGLDRYEAAFLMNIGVALNELRRYDEATSSYEQALVIQRKQRKRHAERTILSNLGKNYVDSRQYEKALSHYRLALDLAREIEDDPGELRNLHNISRVYARLGLEHEALSSFEKALDLAVEIDDPSVGTLLNDVGVTLGGLGRFDEALDRLGSALALHDSLDDSRDAGMTLGNLGWIYRMQGRPEEAITYLERALEIAVKFQDTKTIAEALNNLGYVFLTIGQNDRAKEAFDIWLGIAEKLKNLSEEGQALNALGNLFMSRGQYTEALSYIERALQIYRELDDQTGEESALASMGNIHLAQDRYRDAVFYYDQALSICRERKDMRTQEARNLTNIGSAYAKTGDYQQALNALRRALAILPESRDVNGQGELLGNMGNLHVDIGFYKEGLDYLQRAAALFRKTSNMLGEGNALGAIGHVYFEMGLIEEALSHIQKAADISFELESPDLTVWAMSLGEVLMVKGQTERALVLFEKVLDTVRKMGLRSQEAMVLSRIGLVYSSLGQYDTGLSHYRRSLAIERETEDRAGEAAVLLGIGMVYNRMHRHTQGLPYLEEALLKAWEVGKPQTLWRVLHSLQQAHQGLDQNKIATFYGKLAVNTLQAMRGYYVDLERPLQHSFLVWRRFAYQSLTELLIDQNRLLEAQQVLGMLKEEEYFNFTRHQADRDLQVSKISFTDYETLWNLRFEEIQEQASVLASERAELARKKPFGLTGEETERLLEIDNRMIVVNSSFGKNLENMKDEFLKAQEDTAFKFSREELENLHGFGRILDKLGKGTACIYFLPTEYKLRILLNGGDGSPQLLNRDSPIGEQELNTLIAEYREILQYPKTDPLPQARQLYDKLIGPIADDLEKIGAGTLLVSSIGSMGYLPLGALHDGEMYLAQKYKIVRYTAAAREKLSDRFEGDWKVAAMGVGEAAEGFPALPAVPVELDLIVKEDDQDPQGIFPGIRLPNEDFTRERLSAVLREGYPVVHIASHFRFEPAGTEADSFLLMGDGERMSTLELDLEREKYPLTDVDLLTLSACETAMTGLEKKWGREIEGLGTLAQKLGARSVLATLWKVSDPSTARFMELFYSFRESGVMKENEKCVLEYDPKPDRKLTKAEALSCAQRSFIRGEVKAEGTEEQVKTRTAWTLEEGDFSYNPDAPYSHPYYWAPFILMGNFL